MPPASGPYSITAGPLGRAFIAETGANLKEAREYVESLAGG